MIKVEELTARKLKTDLLIYNEVIYLSLPSDGACARHGAGIELPERGIGKCQSHP